MKVKSLVPKKKLKFKPITAKPLKYLEVAADKDGDGIPQFLDCNDYSAKESGVLHDWIRKQRLLKERKNMAKLDIEPLKEEQEHFDEELSKSETSIEDFKGKVQDRSDYYKKNITEGLEVRKFRKPGKQTELIQRTPVIKHPTQEGEKAVFYLIRPPQKMYWDEERQERSSIPKFKRDVYKPYSPSFASGMFTPQRAPNPPWLVEKQRQRELARLYLRQQAQRGEY